MLEPLSVQARLDRVGGFVLPLEIFVLPFEIPRPVALFAIRGGLRQVLMVMRGRTVGDVVDAESVWSRFLWTETTGAYAESCAACSEAESG
eukprot:784173-Pleurochrysis_carterae.AAC.2